VHVGGIQLRGEHLDGLCDAGVVFMRHRSLPPWGVDVPKGTLPLPPSLSVHIDGSDAGRMFDRAARRPGVAWRADIFVLPNRRVA
jgi:hypothetical protein